jgi:hypothetical protein
MKRRDANLAYDKNPAHFVDMAATICAFRSQLLSPSPLTPQSAHAKTCI